MKKELLFIFLIFIGLSSFSQVLPNFKYIKLNKQVHFKEAEPAVNQTIAYLFNSPINKKNKARAEAGQFLLNWMNGTPDYTFYLEEKETSYFNTDADLMLMYMAGLTKFSLENKEIKDQKTKVIGALNMVLPYLNIQEDKKTWSSDLWLLSEAYQKGRMETFLYPPTN